jgi:hypothetical protein
MSRPEEPLPEHVTAAIEFSSLLREVDVLHQHGLYEALTERMQWFANRGITVTYRREVATLFKTVIRQLAKRQNILQEAEFIQESRRHLLKSPTLSLVLERPREDVEPIRDIRGPGYTKQPVMAYVVTAMPSGSLVFSRDNRIRYADPGIPREVLSHPKELARIRPLEMSQSAIAEGMSALFHERSFEDTQPLW